MVAGAVVEVSLLKDVFAGSIVKVATLSSHPRSAAATAAAAIFMYAAM